jgi:NADH-quinone oxidoreductase subunit G
MGALTLKSLAFYLRNWDTEKAESIDPTDGFGSNTRVYVNNNQIVQIEPEYNIHTFNTWLTDKGRQFFDSMFKVWSDQKENNLNLPSDSWSNITKNLTQILYIHDHCNKQKIKNNLFTIVFENISIEVLSLLVIISQNYSFVNLKRAENFNQNNDLESNFELNLTSNNPAKLANSNICILISTNPRYEGYFLNLKLRQRFFKGNFKCLSIGSLINLTFPVVFLGSNINVLKTIATGNNLTCQTLKLSKNPLTIYNNDLLKRIDGNNVVETLKILNYANSFSKAWNNINCFSSTLSETGIQSVAKFLPVNKQDLTSFSVLYFLNTNASNVNNLKQIAEFKLLNSKLSNHKINQGIFLDQSSMPTLNLTLFNKAYSSNNYYSLPTSLFYENEETYINTEGLIKRTVKVILRKKTKSNWQLLRKIFKHLKTNLNLLNNKDNQLIYFNSKEKTQFKNYIYFQYQATQSLVHLNFYLSVKTCPFTINNDKFRKKTQKLFNTKLKYWLDDFYSGGKDEYSQHSLILTNCSKIVRQQATNFF